MKLLTDLARFAVAKLQHAAKPTTDEVIAENRALRRVSDSLALESLRRAERREYFERIAELMEAAHMAGSGPWQVSRAVIDQTDRLIKAAAAAVDQGIPLRETAPITAQGATGDIDLALQNVEWRREINLSWLEFSRWGIQQIILVSRLWYIKNPLIQRGINVTANYVFGRGVEVTCDDEDANDVLEGFFKDNSGVLGQAALSENHKRLQYDGQVFYIFFPDALDSGETQVRTIDATEIFEVITNPEDTDDHWFYHRKWTQKTFSMIDGSIAQKDIEAYYPALDFEPTSEQKGAEAINGYPIMWDTPVLMQKGGVGVGKWHFDTPKAYAALDWARNSRRLLEADLDTRLALSQVAMTLTTKGGQAALAAAKGQMSTTVGPTANLWDMNPPAVSGGTFASGPGTALSTFDTRGGVRDPSDVREYRAMVAIVFEIPPTFLGDLETANLATATTLDRPTELAMLEKQERWREILVKIAIYRLKIDQGATGGKLREAKKEKRRVIECARRKRPDGRWIYEAKKQDDAIQVRVVFPTIREGDMPNNVKAIAEAMTLDNKGGQVVGIDEREGVKRLAEELGLEDYQDVLNAQYPPNGKNKYDPSRVKEDLPEPIPTAPPVFPGGGPQAPGGNPQAPGQNAPAPAAPTKTAERFLHALEAVVSNGRSTNGISH